MHHGPPSSGPSHPRDRHRSQATSIRRYASHASHIHHPVPRARGHPGQRRARAGHPERSQLVPDPDRRPADRAAAHRPPLRHARKPGPAAGARRRAPRPDRRLPGDHRPRRSPCNSCTTSSGSSPTTSQSASTPTGRSIFTHSQVPELNQLLLPFLSLVTVAELGRNPTVKDEIATTGGGRPPR